MGEYIHVLTMIVGDMLASLDGRDDVDIKDLRRRVDILRSAIEGRMTYTGAEHRAAQVEAIGKRREEAQTMNGIAV